MKGWRRMFLAALLCVTICGLAGGCSGRGVRDETSAPPVVDPGEDADPTPPTEPDEEKPAELKPVAGEKTTWVMRKQKGRDFKIVQFTDIHLNFAGDYREGVIRRSERLIRTILESESPDLVMMTGDTIMCDTPQQMPDAAKRRPAIEAIDWLGALMDEYRIPFTSMTGNHEKDLVQNYVEQGARWEACSEWSLYRDVFGYGLRGGVDNEERAGNFSIEIREGAKPVYALFVFDSGHEHSWFLPEQVDYYVATMENLNGLRYAIPSMLFYHIAVPEYREAAVAAIGGTGIGSVPAAFGFGSNGETAEGMADHPSARRMFAAAIELGCTDMFCGHRHANNSTVAYRGIRLSHGVKSSANTSSPEQIGAKVITIGDGGGVTLRNVYYAKADFE